MTNLKEIIGSEAFSMPQLDRLSIEHLVNGNLRFEIDDAKIDTFFVRKNSPYLFVFFAGARDPQKSLLPYYNRWSWANKMPGSCLYVSDPTFNIDPEKLKLAWYIGTESHDWMQSILKLIKKISILLGVQGSHIIFYGSSGGGFAALKAVGSLNEGVAIAINPQTNILKYIPAHVNNYLNIAFNSKLENIDNNVKKERFSVFSGLARSRKAKFIILQNIQDSFHYKNHYIPLCSFLGLSSQDQKDKSEIQRYNTWLYDCESGHGAEPSELVPKIIDYATQLAKTNFLKLINSPSDDLIIPKRKLNSRISIDEINDVLTADSKKIYGASDHEIDIDGVFISFNQIHLLKLNVTQKSFIDSFDVLDGNLISYENTKKGWLITGFVLRYIRYWDNYVSKLDSDNYEAIIKRIKILAYVISNIQASSLIVSEEEFCFLKSIFLNHLEKFLNKDVKSPNKLFFYKGDLTIVEKVLSSKFYLDYKENLDCILEYNPGYKKQNEINSFENVLKSSRLYRYGFLLKPKKSKFSIVGMADTYWHKINVGNYNLYVHFELPIKKFEYDTSTLYILGDVYIAHGNLSLDEIIRRFIQEDNWDLIDLLSGRFSIIIVNQGESKVFSDPFGSRTIYYKLTEDGPIVGSHSKLVADNSFSKISSVIKNYMRAPEYNNKTTKYLPGDLTIFDDVYYLIPNNFLNLDLQVTTRFWPREQFNPIELTDFKLLVREYFVKLSYFLKQTNNLVYFGLTGGVDTRILIASTKSMGVNFNTITWDYKSLGYYEKDLINGISKYLGRDNVWLNFRSEKQVLFSFLSSVSNSNSGLVRGLSDLVPKTFCFVPNNSMFVRGLGGEILRGAYNKEISKYKNLETLDYFIKIYNGARNKVTSLEYDQFTENAFRNYMKRGNYDNLYNYDVGDLFYWEHRMAIWASNLLNEYDVALKNLVGINSRILFNAAYGLSGSVRFRRELILDLISEFDSFLASYPTD